MERLTERYKDSIANTVLIRECGDKLCKDICGDIECDCSKCELEKALEKLADYEDLEERLHKIFGEKSAFSLADVIDALEMKLSEPDKKHPVNARILTYEEANKWQEYKDLEEQGLLVRLPCKVGTEVFCFFPRDSHYTKCQIKKIEIRPTIFGKICYFAEPVAQRGCSFRYFDNEFGKAIFLTREEAVNKLEEMKNDKA